MPTSERLRAFVALDLPDETRAAITDWVTGAARGRDDVRAVAADALHVTLAFLGHISAPDADRAGALVTDLAPSCVAADLEPGAITAVPRRRPRLFALETGDPSGAASRLQDALAGALSVEGIYQPEDRAFWPHVTVARVRRCLLYTSPSPRDS